MKNTNLRTILDSGSERNSGFLAGFTTLMNLLVFFHLFLARNLLSRPTTKAKFKIINGEN